MIEITNVIENSPAHKAGIKSGNFLISINMNEIGDILDYMYYSADNILKVELFDKISRKTLTKKVKKGEYDDLGLEFDTFLMSNERSCANNCIFCFIDQLPRKPRPMRDSLYFKDDDARLSFLQGNYISLTNLTEREVKRIIKMRLALNVSVHTTNKVLRCHMLGNPRAGEALEHLYEIARAGVELNCQVVICPEVNDGAELQRTLEDLTALKPAVKSIACVPVGITKHRENLTPLKPFDKESALAALEIIHKFSDRAVFASDELYITAGIIPPDYTNYDKKYDDSDDSDNDFGAFPQYENGVGMIALLQQEFSEACGIATRLGAHGGGAAQIGGEAAQDGGGAAQDGGEAAQDGGGAAQNGGEAAQISGGAAQSGGGAAQHPHPPRKSIATGVSAAPFLKELLEKHSFISGENAKKPPFVPTENMKNRPLEKPPFISDENVKNRPLEKNSFTSGENVKIYPIENNFFGKTVTVAGLVTGGDLIQQLLPHKAHLGEELLIPAVMLRADGDMFLDDVTPAEVEAALGVKVRVIAVDGYELYDALKW